jgi:guanylate kinase
VDYRFISKAEFEKRIARGLFLEYAAVHGNYYGTPREDVEREMDSGRDVLLEIDVQGARQVRKNLPGPSSVLIFVAPPSLSALEKRLRRRGTESEEKIALRLKNAKAEMEAAPEFDHVIVNDELGRACEELRTVFSDCRKN